MKLLGRACWKYFIFAGFFSLFINTLQLTFSLYMLAVYDGVLTSHSLATLRIVTLLALLALILWGVLEFCRSRLLVLAGLRLNEILSRRVLAAMLRELGRANGSGYDEGIKDINILRNYLGGSTVFAFFDTPWVFIYLWIIYLVHPVLGLTATAGAVMIFFLGLMQSLLSQKDLHEAMEWTQRGRQWVLTSFRDARAVQSMGMIKGATAGLSRINNQEVILQDKAGAMHQLLGAISQGFGVLMQVIIFGVGAALVLQQKTGSGVIIAASIIMGQALAPIKLAIGAWKQTAEARSAYVNLHQLLEQAEQEKKIPPQQVQGRLQLDHVGLELGERRVLEGIHFTLQPGEILGLVGPNGAGKTSLCRLMLGIWEPTEGSVKLDGQEVFALDKDCLGRFIGYLPQEVELFAGAVKENIARMGAIEAEKVLEAAHKAGAHDIIVGFAQGYDTDIGESGLRLSGGQRQRVGLARALYGDPKLIILDEPNSNLDEAGEAALLTALRRLKSAGATTIMITHKASLLEAADVILMLDKGRQIRFERKSSTLG